MINCKFFEFNGEGNNFLFTILCGLFIVYLNDMELNLVFCNVHVVYWDLVKINWKIVCYCHSASLVSVILVDAFGLACLVSDDYFVGLSKFRS